MELAPLLLNALALGSAWALVALGFVLVLNATGAVNFAQGDLVVAGGFLGVALAGWLPLPGILLLPLVLAGMALLGLVVGGLAWYPLRDRPATTIFISTIAVGIMLRNLSLGFFGAAPRATPALFPGGAGAFPDRQAVAIIVTAAILAGGLHFLLGHTLFGRRLRAAAQDRDMARACGIRVGWMTAVAFALAAMLAGAAGLLLANRFFVTPSDGSSFMMHAYIAVVIGGWGSVPGALAGAMLIAVFEVGVATWLSWPWAQAGLYLALLAILLFRPRGLFGEAWGRRA